MATAIPAQVTVEPTVAVEPPLALPTGAPSAVELPTPDLPTPTASPIPPTIMPTEAPLVVLPTVTPTAAEMPLAPSLAQGPLAATPDAPATVATLAAPAPPENMEQLVVSVVEAPSFALALNGREQVVDATMMVLLSDTRAESRGWHLQMALTVIEPNTARRLPGVALTIPTVAVACGQQPCTLPAATVQGATAPLTPSVMEAVTLLNAAPGSGMGVLRITPSLRLQVPADAYAGAYQINVIMTIVSGP